MYSKTNSVDEDAPGKLFLTTVCCISSVSICGEIWDGLSEEIAFSKSLRREMKSYEMVASRIGLRKVFEGKAIQEWQNIEKFSVRG